MSNFEICRCSRIRIAYGSQYPPCSFFPPTFFPLSAVRYSHPIPRSDGLITDFVRIYCIAMNLFHNSQLLYRNPVLLLIGLVVWLGLPDWRSIQDCSFPLPVGLRPCGMAGLSSEVHAEDSLEPLPLLPATRSASVPTDDHVDESPTSDASKTPSTDYLMRERFIARLSVVNSRITLVQAETSKIRHKVESQRQIELAELKLQMAERNRDRYSEGESQRKRESLQNQVQLAEEQHRQLSERLAWSEKLANGGLISQATVEIDASAVKGSQSERKAAKDRLKVFETIDLERNRTQLETNVLTAQAELELLQQNASSRRQELHSNYLAARQDLEIVKSRQEELNDALAAEPKPAVADAVELSGQAREVELARASMLRAEQELTTMKKHVNAVSRNGERLHKVKSLQLKAFRQGQHSGTLHELSSKIRVISEGLAADEQQLAWSRRVIRKGYITPAELRSAELAVNKRKAELKNVRQQKQILSEHTLERDEFELSTKLQHAANELDRQEQMSTAQIQELKVVASAKRRAWEIRRARFVSLGGQTGDVVAEAGGR